jgi:hypothetical protein
LILTQPQKASTAEPELGTAQPQLVSINKRCRMSVFLSFYLSVFLCIWRQSVQWQLLRCTVGSGLIRCTAYFRNLVAAVPGVHMYCSAAGLKNVLQEYKCTADDVQ